MLEADIVEMQGYMSHCFIHSLFFGGGGTTAPPMGYGLIHEVSRSHPHNDGSQSVDPSGHVINSSQRPLPDNTQHSQQTDRHAPR